MANTKKILDAIKAKDWHTASESFKETMTEKVSARLKQERESLTEDEKRFKTIGVSSNRPKISAKDIGKRAYPDYKGRKFRLKVVTRPMNLASYWDSGSRDYFVIFDLKSMRVTSNVPAQSAFDPQRPDLKGFTLTPGTAVVEHSIFMGKDTGITVHIHPDDAALVTEAKEQKWKCGNCGKIVIKNNPPARCPKCGTLHTTWRRDNR